MIGAVLYIVIYGDNRDKSLTVKQLRLLKRAREGLLSTLRGRGVSGDALAAVQFIQEDGRDIVQ